MGPTKNALFFATASSVCASSRRLVWACLAFVCLSSAALSVQAIGLNEVAAHAMDYQHAYRRSDLDYSISRSGVKSSRAALLPNVSLNANTAYNDNTSFNDSPAPDNDSEYNSHSWSATLSQPVFDLEVYHRYRSSRLQRTKSHLDLQEAKMALLVEVADLYFDYLKQKSQTITTQKELASLESRLYQTERKYAVGTVPKTDVHQAKASLDTTKADLIRQQDTLDAARKSLETITGHYYEDIFDLDHDAPVRARTDKALKDWIDIALAGNRRYQSSQKSLEISRSSLTQAKAVFVPVVEAKVTHSESDTHNPSSTVDPATGESTSTTYTLEMSVPLFAGGANYYGVQQSKDELRQAQLTADEARVAVVEEVTNLFNSLKADVEVIRARQTSIMSNSASLRSIRKAYEVGTRTLTDVLDAERDLYNSIREYHAARYDYVVNHVTFLKAVGMLNDDVFDHYSQWMSTFMTESSVVPKGVTE